MSVTPDGANPGTEQIGGGGGVDVACNCSTGEPVNPATGDFYDTKTDLSIPGAGIPLTFNRTYDAQAAQAQAGAAASAGPLGYGWTDNLAMSVSYNSGTGLATVVQSNGSQIAFQHYAQGMAEPLGSQGVTWCPSDATAAVFCPTTPRYIATLAQGVGGAWTFVNDVKSPVTYTFTSAGALSGIADAGGDTLVSAVYAPSGGQAPCPSGDACTAWSSTPSGETTPSAVLVEAFNSTSELVSVFDAASGAASTQVATFTYSGIGCSTWAGTPQDLCSATDPGSLTTTFVYDTSRSSPYQYDETSMSPPTTGQVANTYNSTGQISKQIITTGSTNEEQDFAYATNSTVANGTQTTVTGYPNGTSATSTITTYIYSNGVEVGQTNGAGATTYVYRDPTTLLAQGTIDGNGNYSSKTLNNYASSGGTLSSSADALQTTDAVGNITQTRYTTSNLPWCSVDAADFASGITCPGTEPTSPPSPGTHIGYTLDIYNTSNELTSSTDSLGNTTISAYTPGSSSVPGGLPFCSIDPAEYQLGTTCPTSPPTTAPTTATGYTTRIYNASGYVTSSTNPDGNTTTYSYGSATNPGLPTVTTNPDLTVTTDTYNPMGEVLTQAVTGTTGTYSATTQYAYDSGGRKWCEVDPYEYNHSIVCPATPPTSPPTGTPGYTDTIYNSDGQVTSTTNPSGKTTQYAYDGAGNKYCTVGPVAYGSGKRCPTTLPLTVPTQALDPYPGVTIYSFDQDGRVIQVTNPLGGITLSTFDGVGNVTQTTTESNDSTNAPNIVTANYFDADNRVYKTTQGYGSTSPATTLTSYDPNGDAFCTVSANAYAAGSSTYQCPAWQAGWISAPPSPATLYSTTPTAAQANNVTTSFANADGAQVQTTNPDVQTSATSVDPDGRIYCTVDPVNLHNGVACPALGAAHVTGTSTTSYDAAGQKLSTTDQLGETTSTTYDPSGHPATVTDPRGKVTTNCYYWQRGTGGCAAAAPSAGGAHDDLYSTTTSATSADPSGEVTTHTYFQGDVPHATTTPAGTTTDSYNAAMLVTSVAYSGTASGYSVPTNLTYTYNADGSRHTMIDASGTTTYAVDTNGDVTSQLFVAGTGTGLANNTVTYGHYTTGALSAVTYPTYGTHTNPAANYAYDALGQMASVTDWLGNKTAFAHDGNGNLTSQASVVSTANPSGTSSTAFSFDNANWNTQATSTLNCSGTNGTLTQSIPSTSPGRNANGQVTQDTQSYVGSCAGPSANQRNYSYDQAGRVVYQGTTAQGASPNKMIYDASGDPTQISSHDSSGSFNSYTQAFDSAGQTTSQTPISGSGGNSSTYTYDTLGDRTSSVTGSTTTSYGFDQLGHMVSTSPNATTYLSSGDGLEAASKYTAPTWGSASSVDGTNAINSISCATSSFCVAVDGTGNALEYTGSSWSSALNIDGTNNIKSVSCPTTMFCEAVDASGNALTFSGTTWSLASWTTTNIDSTHAVKSVSCTSSTFCEAVDANGHALTYNGGWSSAATIDGTEVLNSVSCSTSTSCVAVDGSGNALTYSASGWSTTITNIDGTTALNSVSCASSTTCAAVDAAGNALTYNGTSWSLATNIDGATVLKSVSCPTTSFCTATDNSGDSRTYNGTSWSPAVNVDSTRSINSISCISSTSCVAVDSGGKALVYQSGTVTSQFIWDTNDSLSHALSDGQNYFIYGATGEPVEQVNTTGTPPVNNPTFMTFTPSDSSWLITNSAGVQTNFYRYDAFGGLSSGTPGSPFGYSGQYADASTGLVNDRARFYDSQTGGFTTRDPAFSQTDTAYTYAGGDPVNRSDPSGRSTGASVAQCAGGIACLALPSKFLPGCQPWECVWDNATSSTTCSSLPEQGLAGTSYFFNNESQGGGIENLPLAPASLYESAYQGNHTSQALIYLDAMSQVAHDQQWSATIASLNADQQKIDRLQSSIDKLDQQLAIMNQQTSLSGTLSTISSVVRVAYDGAACISLGIPFAAAGGTVGSALPGPGTVAGTFSGFAAGCLVGVGYAESGQEPPSPR